MNLKGIGEGENESNAGIKEWVNPYYFQAGKNAYSSFRETEGEWGEDITAYSGLVSPKPASPFHRGHCSQQTLGLEPERKSSLISVLKQQWEDPVWTQSKTFHLPTLRFLCEMEVTALALTFCDCQYG